LQSERLPNKLILPLAGTNLWEMACFKINQLPDKYNKYVLCHDEELVNIASKYKNLKIVYRDKKTTSVDGPLTYIFKELKQVNDTHLMFLNPCLSLLSLNTIRKSLSQFEESDCDYATSVKSYKNWLWNEDKKILTDIDYLKLNTKLIGDYYEAAHCFHIFNKKKFFKDGKMLKKDMLHILVPSSETMDIDTKEDYTYAQWRLSNEQ
jgi:CMP-N-acetylneuraminic acid synthetase